MQKKFSRQELYELVWSQPMVTLSKQYNISDTGLRKLCARMGIPIPLVGYWQKVHHGKTPQRKSLSLEYKGTQEVTLDLREAGSGGTTGFQSPLTILHHSILNDPKLPLEVPERLSTEDKLIADVKRHLTEKQRKPSNGIIYSSSEYLDITVSPKNLSRALRFMAALIKLLKMRGHKIEVNTRRTVAIVDGQEIEMALREKSQKVDGVESWQNGATRPTGVLSLQMKEGYHTMEAKDGTQKLEEQLAKILAKIELRAHETRLENEHYQRLNAQRKAEQQIEKERQERCAKELDDFKALVSEAERWRRTRMIREFIKSMKDQNAPVDRIEWAEAKCNWYDPMVESEDELLKDIDRKTLAPVKRPSNSTWQY